MAESVSLNSFPENEIEAVAYLYTQQQDLSGKTPADVYATYLDAYHEIKKEYLRRKKSG